MKLRLALPLLLGVLLAAPPALGAQDGGSVCGRKQSRKKKGKRSHRRSRRHRAGSNLPRGWSWPPDERTTAEGETCKKELREAGVAFRPAPAAQRMATPIVLDTMRLGDVALEPTFRHGPFPMDCHLALSLARAAEGLTTLGVRALRFSGIYQYRRVRGRRVLSRHAFGLAMDVFEVDSTDGERHVVKRDYKRGDELLRGVERHLDTVGFFRGVLSPGNDRRHRDHFHVEARTPAERARAGVRSVPPHREPTPPPLVADLGASFSPTLAATLGDPLSVSATAATASAGAQPPRAVPASPSAGMGLVPARPLDLFGTAPAAGAAAAPWTTPAAAHGGTAFQPDPADLVDDD